MARSARILIKLFLTLHVLSSAFVMCLVSNSLFQVNEHDGGTCDGECELSMSCWMGGGVVEPVGNCHSIFRVTKHGFTRTVGIWNPTIQNCTFWRSDFKWLGFSYGYSYSPNHLKTRPFQIRTFLSKFQMFLTNKMETICLNFKWLGFQISDPFRNPDHLQPNLLSTIQNPD